MSNVNSLVEECLVKSVSKLLLLKFQSKLFRFLFGYKLSNMHYFHVLFDSYKILQVIKSSVGGVLLK